MTDKSETDDVHSSVLKKRERRRARSQRHKERKAAERAEKGIVLPTPRPAGAGMRKKKKNRRNHLKQQRRELSRANNNAPKDTWAISDVDLYKITELNAVQKRLEELVADGRLTEEDMPKLVQKWKRREERRLKRIKERETKMVR